MVIAISIFMFIASIILIWIDRGLMRVVGRVLLMISIIVFGYALRYGIAISDLPDWVKFMLLS